MWVAESLVGKGHVVKGIRRHARARHGIVEYFHCHYFKKGNLLKNYYLSTPKQPHEQLEEWLQNLRKRKITSSL
ncbi:hypothetical protein NQ317_019045 [Molorchus minor]|uniref:Uncharacterized protein n=1 Tax=Molorchus minor TaxID=1323400 RepID=A0ABQ9JYG2_9CUCU|nr:hypothetical protein NQ317_019045 [Molorchus minor]